MTNAKLIKNLVLSMVLVLFSAFSFIGCGEDEVENNDAIKNYKLNFVVGSEVYSTIDFSDASTITMPQDPQRMNYDFAGWFWDAGIWQQPFSTEALPNRELTEEMNVYAKFTLTNYALTINLAGGSVTQQIPTSFTVETPDIILPTPTRLGCNFLGWTGSNGTTPQTSVTIAQGRTGARTYTANWDPIVYNLTINLSDGDVAGTLPTSYTVEDLPLALPTPTRAGYDFVGWTGSNGTEPQTSVTLTSMSLEAKTYTANWLIKNYSLTIDLDEGEFENGVQVPTTYTVLSEDIVLPTPTKEGCTFLGWTGSNGTEPQTSVTIAQGSTGAKQYTANWYDYEAIMIIENGAVTGLTEYGRTLEEIIVPDVVTSIGESAFDEVLSYYGHNLKKLTLSANLVSIGRDAFYGCANLTSLTLPNGLISIGEYAFASCTGLTNITIPASVTSIGEGAFDRCSGITSITIPAGVTSIGYGVLAGCTGLQSVTVASGNTVYDSRNNCNAIIETSTNKLIAGCYATVIPASVTSFGGHVFRDFIGLTSMTIPAGVTSIEGYAFCDCTSLISVTIPSSVTSIGFDAFFNCTSLETINFTGTEEQWNAISKDSASIPSGVTIVYNYVAS